MTTKLKNSLLQNSNCYKTQKLKLSQNSKTKIVTKLKNSYCDKTQQLKLWQQKTEIVRKLKTSNWDRSEELV